MAHNYNSGYAVVDSDPNGITSLQSGHNIKIAVTSNGDKVWKFIESNSAGNKWVNIDLTEGVKLEGKRSDGNLILSLGDFDESDTGGRIIINNDNESINIHTADFQINGSTIIESNELIFRNGVNKTTLTEGVGDNVNSFPNSSGKLALQTEIPTLTAGTNITITGTTTNPIINASGGTPDLSGLVPYTGAVNDVDLGAHIISLGKIVENTNFNRNYISIQDVNNQPLFRIQTNTWNGSSFQTSRGLGFGGGALANNTGRHTTAFGSAACGQNTGSDSNGFGASALLNNTGSSANGFGSYALSSNSGGNVIGIGSNALGNNSGNNSIGIGGQALFLNTGYDVVAVGNSAARNNTGYQSVAIGSAALSNNIGIRTIAIGDNALRYNIGSNSIAIGYHAGYNNAGSSVVGNGYRALEKNVGFSSIGIGWDSLRYNSGQSNISIGYNTNSGFNDDVANIKTITSIDAVAKLLVVTAHNFGPTNSYRTLKYNVTGGGAALPNGGVYIFQVVDANTLRYAEPFGLNNSGSGVQTLTPQFIYNNSITIGNNADANFTKSNQVVLGNNATQEVTTRNDYLSRAPGKGLILRTPDDTKSYRISIDNSGNIVTTLV